MTEKKTFWRNLWEQLGGIFTFTHIKETKEAFFPAKPEERIKQVNPRTVKEDIPAFKEKAVKLPTKHSKPQEPDDSDQRALGEATKDLKDDREMRFKRDWLPKFKEKYGDKLQYVSKMYCYRITFEGKDRIEFYPRGNRLFIVKAGEINRWVKPGLRHLIEKYL